MLVCVHVCVCVCVYARACTSAHIDLRMESDLIPREREVFHYSRLNERH